MMGLNNIFAVSKSDLQEIAQNGLSKAHIDENIPDSDKVYLMSSNAEENHDTISPDALKIIFLLDIATNKKFNSPAKIRMLLEELQKGINKGEFKISPYDLKKYVEKAFSNKSEEKDEHQEEVAKEEKEETTLEADRTQDNIQEDSLAASIEAKQEETVLSKGKKLLNQLLHKDEQGKDENIRLIDEMMRDQGKDINKEREQEKLRREQEELKRQREEQQKARIKAIAERVKDAKSKGKQLDDNLSKEYEMNKDAVDSQMLEMKKQESGLSFNPEFSNIAAKGVAAFEKSKALREAAIARGEMQVENSGLEK